MQRRMEKDTSCLQGNLTTSLEKCIYIALQVMPLPRLVRYLTCFERYITRSAVMHQEHITLVVSHPLVVRGDIRKHKSYAITIALSVT